MMLLFLTIGAGESVEIDRDDLVAAIEALAHTNNYSAQEFGLDLLRAWRAGATESLDAAEASGQTEEIQFQQAQLESVNQLAARLGAIL